MSECGCRIENDTTEKYTVDGRTLYKQVIISCPRHAESHVVELEAQLTALTAERDQLHEAWQQETNYAEAQRVNVARLKGNGEALKSAISKVTALLEKNEAALVLLKVKRDTAYKKAARWHQRMLLVKSELVRFRSLYGGQKR